MRRIVYLCLVVVFLVTGCSSKDELVRANEALSRTVSTTAQAGGPTIESAVGLIQSCSALGLVDVGAYDEECGNNAAFALAKLVLSEHANELSVEQRRIVEEALKPPPPPSSASARGPSEPASRTSVPPSQTGDSARVAAEFLREDIRRLSAAFADAAARGQLPRYAALVGELEARAETIRKSSVERARAMGSDPLSLLPRDALISIHQELSRLRRAMAKSVALASTPSRVATLRELVIEEKRVEGLIKTDTPGRYHLARDNLPDDVTRRLREQLRTEPERIERAIARSQKLFEVRFPDVYRPVPPTPPTTVAHAYPRSTGVINAFYAYRADPLAWLQKESELIADFHASRNVNADLARMSYTEWAVRQLSPRDLSVLFGEAKRQAARSIADAIPGSVTKVDRVYFEMFETKATAELDRRRREVASPREPEAIPSRSEEVQRVAFVRLAENRYEKNLIARPEAVAAEVRKVKAEVFEASFSRAAILIEQRQRISDALAASPDPLTPADQQKVHDLKQKTEAVLIRLDELRRDRGASVAMNADADARLDSWLVLIGRPRPPPPTPGTPSIPNGGPKPQAPPSPLSVTDAVLEERFVEAETASAEASAAVDQIAARAGERKNPFAYAQMQGRRSASKRDVILLAKNQTAFESLSRQQGKTRLPKHLASYDFGKINPRTDEPYPYTSVKKPTTFEPLGGGIHWGEVAVPATGAPLPQLVRYDMSCQCLHAFVGTTRYRSDPIAPGTLRALHAYAQTNQNLTISIGWSGTSEGLARKIRDASRDVLLDPRFVDTRVGQDLILADQIPWDFHKATLANGAPNRIAKSFGAAHTEFQRQAIEEFETDTESLLARLEENVDEDADALQQLRADPLDQAVIVIALNDDPDEAGAKLGLVLSEATTEEEYSSWAKEVDENPVQHRQVHEAFRIVRLAFQHGGRDRGTRLMHAAIAAAEHGRVPMPIVQLAWDEHLRNASKKKQKEFAQLILFALPSPNLAVLLDDSASFRLSNGRLAFDGRMRYMYLAQHRTIDEEEIRATKDDDSELEVRHIEALEEIVNQDYAWIESAYQPLARVAQYARIVAFLRWLRDNRHQVTTDFTDLIGVRIRDPRRTPTIDEVTE